MRYKHASIYSPPLHYDAGYLQVILACAFEAIKICRRDRYEAIVVHRELNYCSGIRLCLWSLVKTKSFTVMEKFYPVVCDPEQAFFLFVDAVNRPLSACCNFLKPV